MGCMNGKCSDETDSVDRDNLIHRQPRNENFDYSVAPLPESPSVNTPSRTLENAFRGSEGFEQSSGGTFRRELDQPVASSGINTDSKTDNRYIQRYDNNHINGMVSNGLNGVTQPPVTINDVRTARGREIFQNLQKSYEWKDQFDHPSPEFLSLMDRLYMECQLHLTALSSRGNVEYRREADMIVKEMITVRNHWGPELLPNSICNAFVRERIPLTLGTDARQFRVDCAQFFEPVPFYGSQQTGGNPGELMKLYRFSVYDLSRNEVILRYYLERSNVTQLYHVLCFTCENYRGQVHPYGTEIPSYWDIRQEMLGDVQLRLLSALSPGSQPPPQAHVATIFPATQGKGPAIIQVPTRN